MRRHRYKASNAGEWVASLLKAQQKHKAKHDEAQALRQAAVNFATKYNAPTQIDLYETSPGNWQPKIDT